MFSLCVPCMYTKLLHSRKNKEKNCTFLRAWVLSIVCVSLVEGARVCVCVSARGCVSENTEAVVAH